MNQYEIELRDKVAIRALETLDKQFRDDKIVIAHSRLLELAFNAARDFMAERQKHLDAEGYNAIDEVHKRYKERVERNGGIGDRGNVGISSGIPL